MPSKAMPAVAPTADVIAAALGPLGERYTAPARAPAATVPIHDGLDGTYSSSIIHDVDSQTAKSKPKHPRVFPARLIQ